MVRPRHDIKTLDHFHVVDCSERLKMKESLNKKWPNKKVIKGGGCLAQLVERSRPIPEVRGSNPVIGKNLYFY